MPGDSLAQTVADKRERDSAERRGIAKLEVRVRDSSLRPQGGSSCAQPTTLQLPEQMLQIALFPAVAHAGAPDDRSPSASRERLEPDRRQIRTGVNGQRHPAERPRIEIDRRKRTPTEVEELELEDALPPEFRDERLRLLDDRLGRGHRLGKTRCSVKGRPPAPPPRGDNGVESLR